MRRFIIQALGFILLVFLALGIAMVFVPSPEMGRSLLAMGPVKHQLLLATPSPRIILVGGSNLSHGLNSQRIHEATGLPIVNMGLHGGLGLRFMLEEVRPAIKRDDLVVLVPEYAQYEENGYWGNREVLGMVWDVMPESRPLLSAQHWFRLLKFMPNYAAKKIMNVCTGFVRRKRTADRIEKNYNSYGDCIGHWNQNRLSFVPVKKTREVRLSACGFNHLESFVRETREKGARVLILPPCFQATSYDHCEPIINQIEREMLKRKMPLPVDMRRYRMEDSLFFDTPYHLTGQGVKKRTNLVIEDLVKEKQRAPAI